MKKLFFLSTAVLLGLASCKENNVPDIENDEELITTMEVFLQPSGGITDARLLFRDTDGAGGEEATLITDTLFQNTTYQVEIFLYDETGEAIDTVSKEVLREGSSHQFFFQFEPQMGISTSYRDSDENGRPIGLQSQFAIPDTTGNTELTIILRHQPEKSARGVADGDITNAEGDSDIEVSWPIYIQ